MKNIHIISTDKPSRLHYSKIQNSYGYILKQIPSTCNDGLLSGQRNIYITSDEEIKEGDWGFDGLHIFKCLKPFIANETTSGKNIPCFYIELDGKSNTFHETSYIKKIILTTDQDLIADGVQAIDDEFLEWFVKNPSCESVEVEKVEFEVDMGLGDSCIEYGNYYKIIIPKEEPKQEKDDSYIKEQKERRRKLFNLIYELEEKKLQEEPKQETLEDELWGSVFAKIKQYGLNNEVLTILKQNFNISKR